MLIGSVVLVAMIAVIDRVLSGPWLLLTILPLLVLAWLFSFFRDPHRQISVRITSDQRSMLKRQARLKDASVGELLRLAIDALPVRPKRKK